MDGEPEPERPTVKQWRGFAAMSPRTRKAIQSRGGKSVPPEARAFAKDHDLAREAGRKGGKGRRHENKQP